MQAQIYENARLTRDPRFDGRFFIGVRTTGVYCRPVCPVKQPKPENVRFFPTAAAAAEAGYRPCRRCRPEAAPGTPAWSGTSTSVNRALRMIGDGVLDDAGMTAMCDRLGITPRHLNRLFLAHVGASPKAVAQTRRLHFARKLLDETNLSMSDIAFSSGYGSVRRFNDHVKQIYGRPPSLLRQCSDCRDANLTIRLSYRPPYDYEGLLAFLAARATPGVESVSEGTYSRTISVEGQPGWFSVSHDPTRHELVCRIEIGNSRSLMKVVSGIKRIFDLDADPLEINGRLGRERFLKELVCRRPGQRVPGVWDTFETVIRAIVGQQVSVKGATTVMGRVARQYGQRINSHYLFPGAATIASLNPETLPMPRTRAMTIKNVAQAVADGEMDLGPDNTSTSLCDQLISFKGVGIWTAQYVAMRGLNDPDAFLHSDLIIKRMAENHLNIYNENKLQAYAEQWRPWRAYACMHLWRESANPGDK